MSPGSLELYDTLDDIKADTVEQLYETLSFGLKGAVGVASSGQNTLSSPEDGYWGRAITLPTGECLQVRVLPRNSFGKILNSQDYRMIAVRRTSGMARPVVGFSVHFLPREDFKESGMFPLGSGGSIGCRGVHVILPSLFSLHDPHRDKSVGSTQLDLEGFHSIRPYSLCIPTSRGKEAAFLLTAGDSYLVMAGHMCGVNLPDNLHRCADVVTSAEHSRAIVAKQRKIVQAVGERDANVYSYSALTLCELLSAEGLLSMLCNSFFYGAMPDMMFSPTGMPLVLCMAVQLALRHDDFGLARCTTADTFANKEAAFSFYSRWNPVLLNGFRAIDCAMKSAFDNAKAQTGKKEMLRLQLRDSLTLWQRIGQRVISKVMSDPREEARSPDGSDVLSTRFGRADLVEDVVSASKYDCFAKKGFCKPVTESPIDKIHLAPRADLRTSLNRVRDGCEEWLRTGMFGDVRISRENVNIAPVNTVRGTRLPCEICGSCFECACKPADAKTDSSSSGSDESDDADDVADNKLNISAMESASGAMALAMIHGPFAMHNFGIKAFLLGPACKNKCADCDKDVDALQGLLFTSSSGQCALCNRRRCFECSVKAMGPAKPRGACCLRCDPAAPRMRTKLAEAVKSGKRGKK